MIRWFLAILLGGCSLSSISDLDLRECSADDDCAPLNTADGIDAEACVLWQCSSARSCELRERDDDDDGAIALACGGSDCDDSSPAARPGAPEVCDGLDNDCSGRVDDLDVEPIQETVVSGVPDPSWSFLIDTWVAYPSSLGGALDPIAGTVTPSPLRFVHDEAFSSATMLAGCHTPIELEPQPPTSDPVGTSDATCRTHAECDDGVLCNGFETCEPRSPDADALGCRRNGAAACPAGTVCDEEAFACRELSVEIACSAAELVAARSADARFFAAVINDVGCAQGELRVGLLNPSLATIAQRGDARRSAAWPALGGCVGATRPAIDSLLADPDSGRLRPQALLAWVGDCHDAPCVARPRVQLIGLWHEEATAGGEPIAWTHGTAQVELETIVPGARPAVVAIDGGYVVAYPSPEGGAWIHVVGALDDPAQVVASEPYRTTIDPSAGPRMAPSIVLVDPVRAGRREMRELVVARGPGGRVGASWTELDGAFFAQLEDGALVDVERIGDGGVELAILGVEHGVVGAQADETGGWIVTWVGEGRVWFRRIGVEGAVGPPRSLGEDPVFHALISTRRGARECSFTPETAEPWSPHHSAGFVEVRISGRWAHTSMRRGKCGMMVEWGGR